MKDIIPPRTVLKLTSKVILKVILKEADKNRLCETSLIRICLMRFLFY
jgi:hypothetical protein